MLILNKSQRTSDPTTREAALWDPFRIMRDMTGWDQGLGRAAAFVPPFEVKETAEAYIFKADLPGVETNDLEISLTGNHLTISGKRVQQGKDASDHGDVDERYFSYERAYGSFSRSFTLPNGCDVEHVAADLRSGVLTLVVPKKPEVQPRRIEIGVKTKA